MKKMVVLNCRMKNEKKMWNKIAEQSDLNVYKKSSKETFSSLLGLLDVSDKDGKA